MSDTILPKQVPTTEGRMTKEQALALLNTADVFFGPDDEIPQFDQTLNLNDAFFWAVSDSEYVPDEELPRVGELFFTYGWHGILYWVWNRRGRFTPEFLDVQRFIEFVAHEQDVIDEEPSSSRRAYKRVTYTLGSEATP